MKVIIIPCGFDNFSYLLICEKTGKALVVDPCESYPILQEIEKQGADLAAILCTHHHADHIGGMPEVLAQYPGLAGYCFHGDQHRIPGATCFLQDGEGFSIGELEFTTLHTPGHTTGSVVYVAGDCLFTGDTLFGGGCGRLFEGTGTQMYTSLKRLQDSFPPATRIFFGHEYTVQNLEFAAMVEPGNVILKERLQQARQLRAENHLTCPSTLELECQTNPFLRCNDPVFIQGIENKGLGSPGTPEELFTAVRSLKDRS